MHHYLFKYRFHFRKRPSYTLELLAPDRGHADVHAALCAHYMRAVSHELVAVRQ